MSPMYDQSMMLVRSDRRIKELEAENKRLKTGQANYRQEVWELENQIWDLRAENERLRDAWDGWEAKYQALLVEAEKLRDENEALGAELATATRNEGRLRALLRRVYPIIGSDALAAEVEGEMGSEG